MRWFASLALAFVVSGSACAQELGDKSEDKQIVLPVPQSDENFIRKPSRSTFSKLSVKDETGLVSTTRVKFDTKPAQLNCVGVLKQGGAVICQTRPSSIVKIGRTEKDFYYENADENGQIIIGFDRDEKTSFVEIDNQRLNLRIKPREYDTSRIDGLPPSQVSTFTEAQLKSIRSSSARKKVGFSSRAKEMGFKNGFISPIKEFRKTTNFGAQRILNGEPKKPHYGVDMAAPVGTPIYAPADGIVSLADDDLYFEGAMVLLDHGQGLISMYLHVNEITVENGQRVKQGEQIATVGSKGRSTGPHLCWRLKWRNRNLDPELLTEWPQDG